MAILMKRMDNFTKSVLKSHQFQIVASVKEQITLISILVTFLLSLL